MVLLQVSLTFGQPLSQADLWPYVSSQERHLVAKSATTSGQLGIYSALGQADHGQT